MLQGDVSQLLQQHLTQVQSFVDQVQLQPDLQRVQRLENDQKALEQICSKIQGAVGELARRVPTHNEIKTSLDLLEARLQLGVAKELQQGDQNVWSQSFRLIEKMNQALEEKFSAKISGLQQSFALETQGLKIELEYQSQHLSTLSQENLEMKNKLTSQPILPPDLVKKSDL